MARAKPKSVAEDLTLKREIFCQEWVDTVGNGTQAALKAFDIAGKEILEQEEPVPYMGKDKELVEERKEEIAAYKREVKRVWNVASSIAHETLRIPEINKRIDEILDERGFNDEAVKKEHYKLLRQDAEPNAKGRAIADYYKLKGKFAPDEVKLTIVDPETVQQRLQNLRAKK